MKGSHGTVAHCSCQDAGGFYHYRASTRHSEAEHCGLRAPDTVPEDPDHFGDCCYPMTPSVSVGTPTSPLGTPSLTHLNS